MKKHKKIFKILFIFLFIFIMTGCEKIDTLDFNTMCVKCGNDVYFPTYLVKLVANLVEFVQVMVPTAIIIVGLIELVKAVIASDEKKMNESKNALIRKIIAGIMILLVFAVIKFAFTAVPNFTDDDFDVMECVSYFITGKNMRGKACPERVTGEGKSIEDNEKGYMPKTKPVKKPGTLTSCLGRGPEDCVKNEYYDCEWYIDCDKCGTSSESPCDAQCWRYEKNGIVKYKFSSKKPGADWRSYAYNSSGVKMDQNNCKATKEEEKSNKENGKCYKCNYGKGIVYEWRSDNENSPCVEVTDSSKNTPEKCESTEVLTKVCWYDEENDKYRFQVNNPGGEVKPWKRIDALAYEYQCTNDYVKALKYGGYCWDCGKGLYYFGWEGNRYLNCEKKVIPASQCKAEKEQYCWRCSISKPEDAIKIYTFKWSETDPNSSGGRGKVCENVPELYHQYMCDSEGYKIYVSDVNDEEEKKKNRFGHCWYCSSTDSSLWGALLPVSVRAEYYGWCESQATPPENWSCVLLEDYSEFKCEEANNELGFNRRGINICQKGD